MPISKKWSRANNATIKRNVPSKAGVYELKAFGQVVYIGRASNLKTRLLQHLRERNPNYYRYETAGFFQSPRRMEAAHLTQYGRTRAVMPPWNNRDPRR